MDREFGSDVLKTAVPFGIGEPSSVKSRVEARVARRFNPAAHAARLAHFIDNSTHPCYNQPDPPAGFPKRSIFPSFAKTNHVHVCTILFAAVALMMVPHLSAQTRRSQGRRVFRDENSAGADRALLQMPFGRSPQESEAQGRSVARHESGLAPGRRSAAPRSFRANPRKVCCSKRCDTKAICRCRARGKLPAAIISDFETWIKLGAPDPRDGKPFGVHVDGHRLGQGAAILGVSSAGQASVAEGEKRGVGQSATSIISSWPNWRNAISSRSAWRTSAT